MRSRSRARRRGRAVARTAAIALIAAGAGAATPVSGAEKAIWGPVTLPDGTSAMTLYGELGVDTLQLSLNWSGVAARRPAAAADPADPAYAWPPELDLAATQAAARGINLALLVADSPAWANGGREPVWAPQLPQDYADFLTAAARRYPSVRRWMIWGEPNRDDRFQPNRQNDPIGPRTYALLLDAAYGALKRESPANRVIGGMTWTSGTIKPTTFVRQMRLPNGRRPRLDWFGHNPFPFRFPKLSDAPIDMRIRDISDSDTFSREIAQAYGRPVPLWLSEYTIQTDHGSATFATFTSPAMQARYVTAGWEIADDMGAAVAGLGWLALLDEPPSETSANWGLLTSALQRKPAFAAFRRAPSERLRPAVAVAGRATRARLRLRGLAVRVTPRQGGTIVVELRRGGRLRASTRARAAAGSPTTLRLLGSAPAGRNALSVRAPGGATVRGVLTLR
jgi:hypothetical protein